MNSEASRPRICVVADHASTEFGGEAILPVHYFRVLRARGFDVWMVVHDRCRNDLETRFGAENDRIIYVRDRWLHILLFRVGRLLPDKLNKSTTGLVSHLYTQWHARRIVRRLIRECGIHLVHQPAPVSPREPSLLYGLGVPVLIGPMNGGMDWAPGFRDREGSTNKWVTQWGRAFTGLLNRLIPGKLRADALFVANDRTRASLPRGARGEIIEFVENGVDLSLWQPREITRRADGVVPRFVFLGRLVLMKGVELLLEAFAMASREEPMELHIIGDGVKGPGLKDQARSLGLEERVIFHGWLPQVQAAEKLREAHILVLPSLRECGGAVVLEAMTLGMPVIATDWGGPADYLDETCGVLVPAENRADFVAGLCAALTQLARDRDRCYELGLAGQKRVIKEFDWEIKVDRMLEHYREAMGSPVTPTADTVPAQ